MAASLNTVRQLHQKQPQNNNDDFRFSPLELDRIRSAVKDEEFVRLLGEYARELADPENRRRYEADIAALERERGYAVTFLNPRPGYVVKVTALSSSGGGRDGGKVTSLSSSAGGRDGGGKVFINVCSDGNVGRPVSEAAGGVSGAGGLRWSIPYSLSQPRRDVDKNGTSCMGE
jgi:dynein assembly factor 2